MKLFSEEVKTTSSNSPLNILQVANFDEIFFGVLEVQINERKYPVEEVAKYKGNPVVMIPIVVEGVEVEYPFILNKGQQEIFFNSENTTIPEVDCEILEESYNEDSQTQILEDIAKLKKDSIKQAQEEIARNAEIAKEQVLIERRKKERALKKYLESARENLVNEFTSISKKIKNELISDNDVKFEEIRESVDNKIDDIAKSLSQSLGKNLQNSSKIIDKSIKKLVVDLYENTVTPRVDKELEVIAEDIYKKVSEIGKDLNNKLSEKVDTSLLEGVNKELDAIRDANIELNNSLNKGVQKALSRVGNVDKKILEISEKFDNRISETEQEITQYFDEKLSVIKEETLDITDESRKYLQNLIQESKNGLLLEIRKIKDEKPIEYILESKKGKPIVKDWDSIEKDWDKKIHDKFENYKTDLRKYIVYASGGGTNATQYQEGGIMNGDLTVVGKISANEYLGLPTISSNYLPLSGGTVGGNVVITGALSASNYDPAANVATFLSNPSSANLRAALTDETGTGAAVFANSPSFTNATVNGVLTIVGTNATGAIVATSNSVANSISLASLLASSATGDIYFSVGRSLTINNAALIGHSNTGGGGKSYAFMTIYGRPASDLCVTQDGLVGIGTATPFAKLDVNGGSTTYPNIFNGYGSGTNVFGRISNINAAGSSTLAFGQTSNDVTTPAWIARYGSLHVTLPRAFEIWNSQLGILRFGTNDIERCRITEDGTLVIGNNTSHASALLEITSTTKGILIPRMTTLQRSAIASPSQGLEVFNTTKKRKEVFNGVSWDTLQPIGVERGGTIPNFKIFEDFPNANTGTNAIGTHGFYAYGSGGSNAEYTFSTALETPLAAGTHQFITAATNGSIKGAAITSRFSGLLNNALQFCFAVPNVTDTSVGLRLWGGYTFQLLFNNNTGELRLSGSGSGTIFNTLVASGITLQNGNFVSGTRYRMHMATLTTTTTDIYFASAPFDSSTWTPIFDGVVTHTAVSTASWGNSLNAFMLQTNTDSAKTLIIDWCQVEKTLQR